MLSEMFSGASRATPLHVTTLECIIFHQMSNNKHTSSWKKIPLYNKIRHSTLCVQIKDGDKANFGLLNIKKYSQSYAESAASD